MGRKSKILPKEKLKAVKEYLNGEGSEQTIAMKYGVARSSFRCWFAKYKSMGEAGLINKSSNNYYSSKFKIQVVNSYLNGEGSLNDIASNFKIPAWATVRSWVWLCCKNSMKIKKEYLSRLCICINLQFQIICL